jgi:hypothetical protein
MTAESMKALFNEWSKTALSSPLAEIFPSEVSDSGWIGNPNATEAELAQAEARLKTTMPPSYREFLSLSNGWPVMLPHLGRLWSSDEIEWLHSRRPGLIESWLMWEDEDVSKPSVSDEDYFVYGQQQDPVLFRSEYLRHLLEISDYDDREDGIYLLNPRIVNDQGEWEAWYLSSELPGAVRYPSFWEMMQEAYERFLAEISPSKGISPEQIELVKKSLLPVSREIKAVDLADLIRAIHQEVDVHLAMMRPQPGQPPTLPQFQQNIAEGLYYAEGKVREIQARERDPLEIRQQLEALANDLESEWRKGTKSALKGMDPGQMLLAKFKDKLTGGQKYMDEQFKSHGRVAGLITASGIIRTFLKR